MRAGNARTSVQPGRREETRSVGYAVRPRRLPPTLPPPDSQWRRWLGTISAISRAGVSLRPPRAKQSRRRRGAARCGAATLAPPHYDQPQTCLGGRTRISPATSRIPLDALVEERVRRGPSPLSCQPSDSLVVRSAAAATGRPVLL